MRRPPAHLRGFSLVEVTLAVGLMAVILTSLVALLPLGVRSAREAAQEARAIDLLTLVEADLRASRTDNGLSPRFQLPLPYTLDSNGRTQLNPALTAGIAHSIGLRGDGSVSTPEPPSEHQITLVYTKIPAAGSMAPLEARLIANWPCQGETAAINELTDVRRVSGYVESYPIFSSP